MPAHKEIDLVEIDGVALLVENGIAVRVCGDRAGFGRRYDVSMLGDGEVDVVVGNQGAGGQGHDLRRRPARWIRVRIPMEAEAKIVTRLNSGARLVAPHHPNAVFKGHGH
jgi:hypothetical protein